MRLFTGPHWEACPFAASLVVRWISQRNRSNTKTFKVDCVVSITGMAVSANLRTFWKNVKSGRSIIPCIAMANSSSRAKSLSLYQTSFLTWNRSSSIHLKPLLTPTNFFWLFLPHLSKNRSNLRVWGRPHPEKLYRRAWSTAEDLSLGADSS